MSEDKYYLIDKQVTKEIMPEFKGEVIDSICPVCKGEDLTPNKCEQCNGVGHYEIEY